MKAKYDKQADAIYIRLSDAPYDHGKDLDTERRIDYDANGKPRGVELLCVSAGVITNDLPRRGEIEQLLEKSHNQNLLQFQPFCRYVKLRINLTNNTDMV